MNGVGGTNSLMRTQQAENVWGFFFLLINDNYLLLKLARCSVIKDSNSMAHPSWGFHLIQEKCLLGTSSGRKRHGAGCAEGVRPGKPGDCKSQTQSKRPGQEGMEAGGGLSSPWAHVSALLAVLKGSISEIMLIYCKYTFSMQGTALSTAEGMGVGGLKVTRPLMMARGEKIRAA